ncbi:MAG: ADP-ribosylglycohydrolase family protein [Chthonomonadetes bacterium]|nr:ADP-ribosylglycohydrolase family protein [Chthonomonadetes bacterium]
MPASAPWLRISADEYLDRMKAGWIGQMVGVGWGAPTEFRYTGAIIPEAEVPAWRPEMVSQFWQDDLYVEMTFLRTLEQHGLKVNIRQAGIDFANSRYPLWHANRQGRENLRNGIAPPDSGHPQFNPHADDIDYQIEADFSGLIAPGIPQAAVDLGEVFGRLMNYGDGVYGGQFVGGMYATAFFESDPVKIVEAGLRCIPSRSQYAEAIRDVLRWYRQYPNEWQRTWELVERKYNRTPEYRRFSCTKGEFNIDAKLNGAYIVMGLLYGGGDIERTITVAMRCGQDSDCNPSNAGGILFTTIGYARLPERFKLHLDPKATFAFSEYTFDRLVDVCLRLARQAVIRYGGRIQRDGSGKEVWLIPVRPPRPSRLVQSWSPERIAGARFSLAEMARIRELPWAKALAKSFEEWSSGWTLLDCGEDMEPGLRQEWNGRRNVFVTHPLNQQTACRIVRTLNLPAGRKSLLKLTVGHHPQGDWTLVVKANGEQILRQVVGRETARNGWLDVAIDLSRYAGQSVRVELLNEPSGWSWEAGYWAQIAIEER